MLLATVCLLYACKEKQETVKKPVSDSVRIQSTVVYTEDNVTPTVDIAKYTLIGDPQHDRTSDVKEILAIKRKWPLAMQSLNPLEFDSILSRDFTFKGSHEFFTRADYIKNRTTPDEWKITRVKYDNVTLQFFGNTGVLSYVNHITNMNIRTGATEFEHISWVDIYVLEDGAWKIEAAHSIDYRLETPGDNDQGHP
jgi:hypothetical protein